MKKRVLILSGVVPAIGRGGGCMALHRHFVERDDFEVAAAGTILNGISAKKVVVLKSGQLLERLQRTRFRRLFVNLQIIWSWLKLPRELVQFIRAWRPEIIFTVPDNLHLGWAWLASRRFRIPLGVNFQDLFPVSRFVPKPDRPYEWVSRFLMRRFEMVDRRAEAVFYTSEGMQDWFVGGQGGQRGHVLYPVGADLRVCRDTATKESATRTLVYAGNCYGAYGQMLLPLCRALEEQAHIQLKLFTAGNDWPVEDKEHFRSSGVLCDFLPFDELKLEFEQADAFLTVMSFDVQEKPFVATSFTTKWLDYAPFGKPVLVWAPPYSSAAMFARRHNCGAVIEMSSAGGAAREIANILEDKTQCRALGEASLRVAEGVLNAGHIHSVLLRGLEGIGR